QISELGCKGTPFTATVFVNPTPNPELEGGSICVDLSTGTFQSYTLDAGNYSGNFNFQWYYNGSPIGTNSSTHQAVLAGDYYVVVTDNNYTTYCSGTSNTVTVTETNPATSFTYTVTNAFSDNATIVVNVPDGNGVLMYQIDDEELQDSNIFTGVSAGLHTITVVDTQGCTYLTQEVLVIDYPKYFTPNGDGINDYWNIIGLQNQPGAKLYIFDRYGKLIKQISTVGQGWDGTFNSQQLPSTDYWFTIEFDEGGQQKVFRAHFSLIR
ncbi:MAG: T9SS type B sorting domain-containing protein, partial [Flavobacterium sp.]